MSNQVADENTSSLASKIGGLLFFFGVLAVLAAFSGYGIAVFQIVQATAESPITTVSGPFFTLVATVVLVLAILFRGWSRSRGAKRLIVLAWVPVFLAGIAAGVLALLGY